MTFLDAIEAGVSFDQALAEGRTNFSHELDKAALQILFKKRLTIGQIARGFDVADSFVIEKCKKSGIVVSIGDETLRSEKRKMNALEAVLYGIDFEKAVANFVPAALRGTKEDDFRKLIHMGLVPERIATIFDESVTRILKKMNGFGIKCPGTHNTLEPSNEAVMEEVFEMVQQGFSVKEINDTLNIKHPGAMGYIRSARKRLAKMGRSVQVDGRGEKEVVSEISSIGVSPGGADLVEQLGEVEVHGEPAVIEMENNSYEEAELEGFEWYSNENATGSIRYTADMIRIRKKDIAFSVKGRIFEASKVEVGFHQEKNLLAIRRVERGYQVRRRKNDMMITGKTLIDKLSAGQSFRIFREMPDLILAKFEQTGATL